MTYGASISICWIRRVYKTFYMVLVVLKINLKMSITCTFPFSIFIFLKYIPGGDDAVVLNTSNVVGQFDKLNESQ